MAILRWTRDAANELEQIAQHLGKHEKNPAAATRVIRGIYAKCQQYAEQPGMFYEPITDGNEVFHVVHGSRDYLQLFETEGEANGEEPTE